MQRSKVSPFPLFAAASAVLLTLAGCASAATEEPVASQQDESAEQVEAPAAASESSGEAVLSYGDITYTAQLQHCSLSGGEDALFHGAVTDDTDAHIGYLEGDFSGLNSLPQGEARIDFGATGSMQSSEEFIALGTVAGEIVVTDASDSSIVIVGGTWDQEGTLLGTGTLRVNC